MKDMGTCTIKILKNNFFPSPAQLLLNSFTIQYMYSPYVHNISTISLTTSKHPKHHHFNTTHHNSPHPAVGATTAP